MQGDMNNVVIQRMWEPMALHKEKNEAGYEVQHDIVHDQHSPQLDTGGVRDRVVFD